MAKTRDRRFSRVIYDGPEVYMYPALGSRAPLRVERPYPNFRTAAIPASVCNTHSLKEHVRCSAMDVRFADIHVAALLIQHVLVLTIDVPDVGSLIPEPAPRRWIGLCLGSIFIGHGANHFGGVLFSERNVPQSKCYVPIRDDQTLEGMRIMVMETAFG